MQRARSAGRARVGRRHRRGTIAGALALACLVVGLGAQQRPSGQAPAQPPSAQAPGQPPSGQPPDSGAPAGQQAPGPEGQAAPQPVFRTGINFVRVDVIVTDKKGAPVTDLTQADFEVSEDDKRQEIETFKLVKVTGLPDTGESAPRPIRTLLDEETEAQRDDVRIFVILLDDYHVRRGASLGVREPLIKFLQMLSPFDLVGLMYPLSPVTDLRLTRNHEALAREIARFEGRKFDYRPRNEFEEKYSMYPATIVERVRNEVSLSALEGLVTHLGAVREGRKSVVLVSEGYSNYLPPQLRDPIAEMPGVGNPNRSRQGVGDPDEDRTRFFTDLDILTTLREVYDAANRSNTSIYALDPRGLAAFEYDIGEAVGLQTDSKMLGQTLDTLRVLASETDGRAIVNRNDLEGGLRQVVSDASAYYLIGYNSTQAPQDGKFHEIKVKVKRSGVQVRARKGYWALTAEETARATAPPKPDADPGLTNAIASVESPSRARYVRTWIGTSPGEDGKTKVSFVWEPVPPVPGAERRSGVARVGLIAAGQDDIYFRGKVEQEGGAGTAAGSSPATSNAGRVEFEAEPGKVQLRVSVEDTAGEVVDTDMLDVDVPDYTSPEIRLTPLQVLRARNALEFRALNADPSAIPVAGREFRRTERLLIRFTPIGPGSEHPTTAVRLLNRAGQPMTDLQANPIAGQGPHLQVDLPLAGLAPGEYVVEVTSKVGEGQARQFVGFRVIS